MVVLCSSSDTFTYYEHYRHSGHISGLAVVELSSYQATCSDIDIQVSKKIEKVGSSLFLHKCFYVQFIL